LQSGNNSDHTDLSSAYAAAIQNAVTPNWLRPDNIVAAPCDVHIVQSPGGDVISATADSSCPYDDAGKRSVENAVLRTRTLPYKGFESVFQRNLTFTFRPQ
jgi:colicin import membrane protein